MGQTSSPETLVSYQKMTPGKNPKAFILLAISSIFHVLHDICNTGISRYMPFFPRLVKCSQVKLSRYRPGQVLGVPGG
jgi:hypothetical protein